MPFAIRWIGRVAALLVAIVLWGGQNAPALADQITLKDGRVIEGSIAQLSSMAENPNNQNPAAVNVRLIVFVDDNLRRTFVSKRQVAAAGGGVVGEPEEKIFLRQPVPRNGGRIGMVGPLVSITPLDDFGRRTVQMLTAQGTLPIIQGITEMTPHWSKLEALQMEGKSYMWDMRVATSSIPPADLEKILAKLTDPKNLDQRLRVVRFYLQSERYKDAESKLRAVVADFPENKEQFAPIVLKLHQGLARQILREIQARREAGQHGFALAYLQKFPAEDVAGETLQAVRQMLDEYQASIDGVNEVLTHFEADLTRIKDSAYRSILARIREELKNELNLGTIHRLDAYKQLWDDGTLSPEDKVGLAVSGWLVGTADATRKLPVAVSLFETRELVKKYMHELSKLKREEILAQLKLHEGATPPLVSKLLVQMKPAFAPGEQVKDSPGLYQHEVEILPGEPPASYYVQLPPEYDPHRLYPTIVSLHGSGSTPLSQIDWWAGSLAPDGSRRGQATRQGYIVIAPAWAKPQQRTYGFSAEEHAAVLNSLRDACRRFAVDTDRVFLSGHSMGGDAAWDVALAHPDQWAGVIPIAAVADKYVSRYWENAAYMPFYLVSGQLDGDYSVRNSIELDRYFKHGYNTTVVEFQGRGHEHFSDEILRIFDWMDRNRRDFFPKEFITRSMRDWDNSFWWLELEDLPAKSITAPESWPPPVGLLPVLTKASVKEKNTMYITTGAARAVVWLSPELVDFKQPVRLTVNGTRLKSTPIIEPDLTVLLEDVRTRGDRQHVFWGKVEMPAGRVNMAGR